MEGKLRDLFFLVWIWIREREGKDLEIPPFPFNKLHHYWVELVEKWYSLSSALVIITGATIFDPLQMKPRKIGDTSLGPTNYSNSQGSTLINNHIIQKVKGRLKFILPMYLNSVLKKLKYINMQTKASLLYLVVLFRHVFSVASDITTQHIPLVNNEPMSMGTWPRAIHRVFSYSFSGRGWWCCRHAALIKLLKFVYFYWCRWICEHGKSRNNRSC